MQAFVFNQRRKQFQDPRVRRAFTLAFNFEEANKKLFYDLYVRIGSYFDNSELANKGLPQGRELEILNEVKSEVPPEVFTTEYKNPVNNTPDDSAITCASVNLREAAGRQAASRGGAAASSATRTGVAKANMLRNDKGETLNAEFLLVVARVRADRAALHAGLCRSSASRPACASSTARNTSAARTRTTTTSSSTTSPQSESPGNEQRDFWGSAAADRDGCAQHRRHQEPGGRQADRQGRVRQGPRGAAGGDAARSTACCCGTTTSCRSGTIRSSASPIGTCSAARQRCRRRPRRLDAGLVVRRRRSRRRSPSARGQ